MISFPLNLIKYLLFKIEDFSCTFYVTSNITLLDYRFRKIMTYCYLEKLIKSFIKIIDKQNFRFF